MMPRCVALATMMVLAASSWAAAQGAPTTGGEIRGRVVNGATKTPIVMATVYVTDSGSAGAAAHTSTDGDGGFRVPGLPPGHYRVRIIAIGYAPREVPSVEIGASSASVDVGTVTL